MFRRAVRNYGHGVEGLLRVNRVFGVRGVAAVVAVDAAKSLAAVLLGGAIFRAAAPGAAEAGVVSYAAVGKLFAGFCLLLGHCWPVLYGFRGGKGAVCALVTLLCVHVPLGLLSLAVCAALIALGCTWAIYARLIAAIGQQAVILLSTSLVETNFMMINLTWIYIALGISIGAFGSILSMRRFLQA